MTCLGVHTQESFHLLQKIVIADTNQNNKAGYGLILLQKANWLLCAFISDRVDVEIAYILIWSHRATFSVVVITAFDANICSDPVYVELQSL